MTDSTVSSNNRRRLLRGLLLGGGATLLAGCEKLNNAAGFRALLAKADAPTEGALTALTPDDALAEEFSAAHVSPVFKANGSIDPRTPEYLAIKADGFAGFRLRIGGLVATPLALSLAELRARPARTQITRHDCVEGWSCIGKWTGAPLAALLAEARPLPEAKYVVFRCADSVDNDDKRYYESCHLREARHPQTILAYDLNDAPLDVAHGAPIRVRLERKLGYKHAKYLLAIDVVDRLDDIGMGKGGYWEDHHDYGWHAGI
jgi:DMSO/TMAO reductase YedYZ molybdopterin-dependent catalytic subunit